MNEQVLKHYLNFGVYTYPGEYQQKLDDHLPDDIREVGRLVRKNFIHRTTLSAGNTGTNSDLRFGDMSRVPWWRQPEDDVLVTASSMLAELYRRDKRGFIEDRDEENKLVLTCRFVAIMMTCILRLRGIPTRTRAGHAPYFDMGDCGRLSVDHWINQYWCASKNRWVTIDVDGSFSMVGNIDPYDIPDDKFDFAPKAWLDIREGRVNPQNFYNAKPERGAIVVLWSLFYDFHCLMNHEIIYTHGPIYGDYKRFASMTVQELNEIDDLARLMIDPDTHFEDLLQIWNNRKDYRILYGGLL